MKLYNLKETIFFEINLLFNMMWPFEFKYVLVSLGSTKFLHVTIESW
jgi:hypothetical protein